MGDARATILPQLLQRLLLSPRIPEGNIMSFQKETFKIESFFFEQLAFLNQTLFLGHFLLQFFIPCHGLWHALLCTFYSAVALSEASLVLVCATSFCLLVSLFFSPSLWTAK